MSVSTAVWSEEAQAAVLLLIADIRLDERVGDPRLHSIQGTFKVPGLDVLSFDVLLQGQEGSLSAYCCYLGQETDTDIQLSGRELHPLNTTKSCERRLIDFSDRLLRVDVLWKWKSTLSL